MSNANPNQNPQLSVRDTTIHDNLGNGIHMNITGASSSGTAVLNNVRQSRMANGLAMVAGLTRATVSDSALTLNFPGTGINLSGGTPIVHIDRTNLIHNQTGIAATVGAARIQGVYITNCGNSITTPNNVRSWGDNMIFENGTDTLPGGADLTKE